MFKIKRVHLRNWMTVKDQVIDFPDRGLVVVSGVNNASAGKMSSVGSGKTALGEAIGRSILGIDGRFAQLAHYSRHDGGDTYVKVDGTINGQEFCVEHGYKCKELSKTGAGLRYRVGQSDPVERNRVQATRLEIDTLIGISAELSKWTVHLDGGLLQFDDLSQRNAVGLLMRAMNQPPWDELYAAAHKACTEFKQELQAAQVRFSGVKVERDRSSADVIRAERDLENERARVDELISKRDELVSIARSRVNELENKLASDNALREKLEQNAKLEAEKAELESRKLTRRLEHSSSAVDEMSAKHSKVMEQKARISADVAALERQIETLDRKQRAPLPPRKSKSVLSTVVDKVKLADNDLASIDAVIDEVDRARAHLGEIISDYWEKPEPEPERPNFEDEIAELRAQLKSANEHMSSIKLEYSDSSANLSSAKDERAHILGLKRTAESVAKPSLDALDNALDKVRDTTRLLSDANKALAKAELPVESRVSALEAVLKERKDRVSRLESDVNSAADDVAKSEVVLTAGQYWEEAYGPTGIPNMILRDSIDSLNDVSRRISSLMTGGTIAIGYYTDKGLKSGDSKSQLNISVENKYGATRIQGNSKGESGLTNLIIAETLAEVGRVSGRIGYRWYDEITNGQDSQVRSSIFAYLKDLANRAGIVIFLVDHSPEATNYADHVLIAEKCEEDGGTTTFKWSR